jgi:membrane protease YdiL (CAAX protease family)
LPADAQISADPQPPSPSQKLLLAPWWHTALLIAALLFMSVKGSTSQHPLAAKSKLLQYVGTMIWEWILTAYIWLGIRKRIRLRDLVGGRWETWEDFFLDVVYAGAFWVCAWFILGVLAWMMHLAEPGKLESMRKQLGFLAPETNLQLAVWFCVSATAGLCEEIIFRGYLQRQFALAANSTLAGVLISAIVFGASHGYEGVPRMILIGIYGLMFGLLAWWRKSLRAGMMAHAWHDAISGAFLRVLK